MADILADKMLSGVLKRVLPGGIIPLFGTS
jgi:hypothetical protein